MATYSEMVKNFKNSGVFKAGVHNDFKNEVCAKLMVMLEMTLDVAFIVTESIVSDAVAALKESGRKLSIGGAKKNGFMTLKEVVTEKKVKKTNALQVGHAACWAYDSLSDHGFLTQQVLVLNEELRKYVASVEDDVAKALAKAKEAKEAEAKEAEAAAETVES